MGFVGSGLVCFQQEDGFVHLLNRMAYQTINPYTEALVKIFPEHTDAQFKEIIGRAERRLMRTTGGYGPKSCAKRS